MSSVTVHIKEVISGAVSHRIVFMLCHLNLTNYYEDIQLLCLTCYFYSQQNLSSRLWNKIAASAAAYVYIPFRGSYFTPGLETITEIVMLVQLCIYCTLLHVISRAQLLPCFDVIILWFCENFCCLVTFKAVDRSEHCLAVLLGSSQHLVHPLLWHNLRVVVSDCSCSAFMYTMGHKNVPFYFCPYLRQLLTDFPKIFYQHTLQTICNNLIVMYPITP